MSIWERMKINWSIKKHEIKNLGINPDKSWQEIMLKELEMLSDFLDLRITDLIE